MSSSLRRFFACLLLVLLPFQAFAAGDAASKAPLVACSAAMMAEMGCCDADDSGAGCHASDCITPALATVPADVQVAAAPPLRLPAAESVPGGYRSHIPDGPQRPPQSPV